MMSANAALAEYETARHRLPQVRGGGACLPVRDLSELAHRFDTFLLDAFGVLNIGEDPIAGAPERVADLQAAGKRVMVLTNAASVPKEALLRKYARLGYDFAEDDVISSRETLMAGMDGAAHRHWGVMAPPELQGHDLNGLTFDFLGTDPGTYAAADAFLLLGSGGWDDVRQSLLESALADRPRPVWVGNPDVIAPRRGGFSIEPGYYAHKLADSTGIYPRFFGKPFLDIYDRAFAVLGPAADPSRTLMVGDSLHTDVLGAQNAGIASALIKGFGFFADSSAEDAIADCGIAPDFLVDRP